MFYIIKGYIMPKRAKYMNKKIIMPEKCINFFIINKIVFEYIVSVLY